MWNILIVFNWLQAELVRSEYVAKLLLNGRNTDESLHTLKDYYCLREDNPLSNRFKIFTVITILTTFLDKLGICQDSFCFQILDYHMNQLKNKLFVDL